MAEKIEIILLRDRDPELINGDGQPCPFIETETDFHASIILEEISQVSSTLLELSRSDPDAYAVQLLYRGSRMVDLIRQLGLDKGLSFERFTEIADRERAHRGGFEDCKLVYREDYHGIGG